LKIFLLHPILSGKQNTIFGKNYVIHYFLSLGLIFLVFHIEFPSGMSFGVFRTIIKSNFGQA